MNAHTSSVLILDDDDAVRESFMDYFEDRGWLVTAAATAGEGLEALAHGTPDCAVIDIRLPDMDGNEFIREAGRRNIRFACVLCTGSPEYQPPTDIAALPQVSGQVFAKPVTNLSELENTLRRQIETYRTKEEHPHA